MAGLDGRLRRLEGWQGQRPPTQIWMAVDGAYYCGATRETLSEAEYRQRFPEAATFTFTIRPADERPWLV